LESEEPRSKLRGILAFSHKMKFYKSIFSKQSITQTEMLENINSWEISSPGDNPDFFTQLNIIAPEGAMMYFEDVYENKVKNVLKEISTDSETILCGGTLWPKPDFYHVPATEVNIIKFQKLAEQYSISIHFHLHKNNKKVLEWYDAFDKDPIYIY
jgi:hypothetical protein